MTAHLRRCPPPLGVRLFTRTARIDGQTFLPHARTVLAAAGPPGGRTPARHQPGGASCAR